jgi:predicted butyrate kinase (DUF1464 family)
MKRVLYKLDPMEAGISGKTVEVYNLKDTDPDDILVIRINDDSPTGIDELASAVSETINVPCLIVPHRVEFLTIKKVRKVSLLQRVKSFIINLISGKK